MSREETLALRASAHELIIARMAPGTRRADSEEGLAAALLLCKADRSWILKEPGTLLSPEDMFWPRSGGDKEWTLRAARGDINVTYDPHRHLTTVTRVKDCRQSLPETE